MVLRFTLIFISMTGNYDDRRSFFVLTFLKQP